MSPDEGSAEYRAAIEFLLSRINYERTSAIPYSSGEFKLDRMRELVRRLGDPHLGLKVVHVAGTKGKGSTCAMISSVLTRAGYRTGLYTSPHLARLEERIAIDGVSCTEFDVIRLVDEIRPIVEALDRDITKQHFRGPTFFEITTAMAFLHFVQQQCDFVVLEVGLGGRLDSTNVCAPLVTAITSISFDHMKQLGNTLALIAGEKAGIFKGGVPAISGVTHPEPQAVIRQRAEAVGTQLFERSRDFFITPLDRRAKTSSIGGGTIGYRETVGGQAWHIDDVELGLLGEHQEQNASVAIASLRALVRQGYSIADSAIRAGLRQVSCPARIEVMGREPWVILDTAHNLASIQALCDELDRTFPSRPRVLVFATSRDKDALGMLRLLLPRFDHVVLTRYLNNPRARSEQESLELANQTLERWSGGAARPELFAVATPQRALEAAKSLALKTGLICITGSFFLAAEVRPLLGTAD